MTEDADIIFVGMGTLAMPVRVGVRRMREQGKKGRVRPRQVLPAVRYRRDPRGPQRLQGCGDSRPRLILRLALLRRRAVQRNSLRIVRIGPAPVGAELHRRSRGREVLVRDVEEMAQMAQDSIDAGKVKQINTWIGVRE